MCEEVSAGACVSATRASARISCGVAHEKRGRYTCTPVRHAPWVDSLPERGQLALAPSLVGCAVRLWQAQSGFQR